MAKTQLFFEDFNGTIGADAAPTMTTKTAGSFTVHRGGARTAAMAGPRCGVMRDQDCERRWTITTSGIYTLEGRVRVRRFGTTTGNGINYMFGATRVSDDLQILIMGHHVTGNWCTYDYVRGTTDSGVPTIAGTWYDFVMSLTNSGGLLTAYKFEIKASTASTWTQIISRTALADLAASDRVQLMNDENQGSSNWAGHVSTLGCAQLASMAESTDAWPTTLVAPVTGLDYYMGPQTGASTNDGADTSHQLAMTTTAWNDEVKYGIGNYDSLITDNSTAVWDIGATMLNADLKGTTDIILRFLGERTNRKAHLDISGAAAGGSTTWTQYDSVNYPNVWKATLSLFKPIVYRDGVAIPIHCTGAAITDNRVALNTTDAYWSDYAADGSAATMYIHSAVNPNAVTTTYYASRQRTQGAELTGPLMDLNNWTNVRVVGFGSQYIGYVHKTDNDNVAHRGCIIDVNPTGSGYCDIVSVDAYGTGKHYMGIGLSGATTVRVNGYTVGAGHPYAGVGNASTFSIQVLDDTTTPVVEIGPGSAASTADPVFMAWHGTDGYPSGRIASTTLKPGRTSGYIDNTGAICTLLTVIRGAYGTIYNATPAVAKIDKDTAAASSGTGISRYRGLRPTRSRHRAVRGGKQRFACAR